MALDRMFAGHLHVGNRFRIGSAVFVVTAILERTLEILAQNQRTGEVCNVDFDDIVELHPWNASFPTRTLCSNSIRF